MVSAFTAFSEYTYMNIDVNIEYLCCLRRVCTLIFKWVFDQQQSEQRAASSQQPSRALYLSNLRPPARASAAPWRPPPRGRW